MFCNFCGKNQAAFLITETVEGVSTKLHLCSACVQKVKHQPVGDFSIADMFVGILDEHVSPQQEMSLKCSGCDLTYDEFSIQGRFGCSKCYNAFQVHLPALLKNIQRTFLHVGKTQMSRPKSTDALRDELKKELAMAIKKENYERAAQLRDKLRGMVD